MQQAAGFPDTNLSPPAKPTKFPHHGPEFTEAQWPIRYLADRQGIKVDVTTEPQALRESRDQRNSSATGIMKTGLHPFYPVMLARKGMRALILGPLLWYLDSGSLA